MADGCSKEYFSKPVLNLEDFTWLRKSVTAWKSSSSDEANGDQDNQKENQDGHRQPDIQGNLTAAQVGRFRVVPHHTGLDPDPVGTHTSNTIRILVINSETKMSAIAGGRVVTISTSWLRTLLKLYIK